MSTAELKSNLHRLIVETEDTAILLKIQDAFSKLRAETQSLTAVEKKLIEKGLKDIEEGRVYTNDEVRTEINEWIAKNN